MDTRTDTHMEADARWLPGPRSGTPGGAGAGPTSRTYPLSASCPPPCPRLLARLDRLSLALTPSVCPAAAAPAWDAHSTATPRAIPSSRPRHIASPEPPGCERPLPPLRRRRLPVPAALSPTSLSNASCEGGNEEEGELETEEKRPRPPRAPRRLPPRPGAVGPRPARRYRARERRRPRGTARGCPGPRGLCLPFSSIRGGSRTRRGQTAAAATAPEAAPGLEASPGHEPSRLPSRAPLEPQRPERRGQEPRAQPARPGRSRCEGRAPAGAAAAGCRSRCCSSCGRCTRR